MINVGATIEISEVLEGLIFFFWLYFFFWTRFFFLTLEIRKIENRVPDGNQDILGRRWDCWFYWSSDWDRNAIGRCFSRNFDFISRQDWAGGSKWRSIRFFKLLQWILACLVSLIWVIWTSTDGDWGGNRYSKQDSLQKFKEQWKFKDSQRTIARQHQMWRSIGRKRMVPRAVNFSLFFSFLLRLSHWCHIISRLRSSIKPYRWKYLSTSPPNQCMLKDLNILQSLEHPSHISWVLRRWKFSAMLPCHIVKYHRSSYRDGI